MQVKRFSEAKTYEAPNHRDFTGLRLFGAEAGGSKSLIVGISHFLPGGGAGPDASPPEKVYFVLEGELTVIIDGKETVLKKHDSASSARTKIARSSIAPTKCVRSWSPSRQRRSDAIGVMAGLVPAIHGEAPQDVDARHKAGHGERETSCPKSS